MEIKACGTQGKVLKRRVRLKSGNATAAGAEQPPGPGQANATRDGCAPVCRLGSKSRKVPKAPRPYFPFYHRPVGRPVELMRTSRLREAKGPLTCR